MTAWLHTVEDVQAALVENPPEIPGWELCRNGLLGAGVWLEYEDDDGAVATIVLTVTSVELDESRVRPDPPEREKGDDGRC